MSLKCGLVGLPNVGKSTLFNYLTKQSVPALNYPFCTIDPNIATVAIPNPYLDKLHQVEGSKKKIPTVLQMTDIAGLISGACNNKGMGNSFLSNIREVDMILHVVRCFEDNSVVHVASNIDPVRDLQVIQEELILADMMTLEAALRNKKLDIRTTRIYSQLLHNIQSNLWPIHDLELINDIPLLTLKPRLVVANGTYHLKQLKSYCSAYGLDCLAVDYTDPEDSVSELVKRSYSQLGWTNFLTTGEKESRSWPIKKHALAIEAAGRVHTDFIKKFVRAKVLPFHIWEKYGSFNHAFNSNAVITVGKDYSVCENDIIIFMIRR